MALESRRRIIDMLTLGAVIYLLAFAFAMALFPIRPFWNDEWRLTYNIKFKSIEGLWGRLSLLQQCPRVYLSVLKEIAAFFDYSYTSLRLPPLVISCASIALCFRLKKKLFPNNPIYGNLFILILISSQTFTDYLVQVKHYEADLFLCLVGLLQLIYLLDIAEHGTRGNRVKYVLCCLSLSIAPFFSYVYPIVICPIFFVLPLRLLMLRRQAPMLRIPFSRYMIVAIPLMLTLISIAAFYIVDVKQLMADRKMYESYLRVLGNAENKPRYLADFWNYFALVGSGFVFEIVFGIIGIVVFLHCLFRLLRTRRAAYYTRDYLRLYAVLLIMLTLLLVFSGKITGSIARLTSFTVPSISLLITWALTDMKVHYHQQKTVYAITLLLFVGLLGNIFFTCINNFTYPEYSTRINIYRNTSAALDLARTRKTPILITEGIRGERLKGHESSPGPAPGVIRTNTIDKEQIEGADVLCVEAILKTMPAYKTWDTVPVYTMPDMKWNRTYVQQLPARYKEAVVCDGLHYAMVKR